MRARDAAALLIATEAGYLALLTFEPRRHLTLVLVLAAATFTFYGAIALRLRGRDVSRQMFLIVIAGAILFRLTLLPLGVIAPRANAFVDDDVWRYLWDGRVTAQTGNPYAAPPNDARLDHLSTGDPKWTTIRSRVNHPDLPTIYPPVAEAVFFIAHALAPGSVLVLKIVLVACDWAAMLFMIASLRLLRRPVTDVVLYAWNPLVILMFAGSGHIDVVMVMFMSAAVYFAIRGRTTTAGFALGLAIMAKLTPLLLVPLFARQLGRKALIALAAVVAASAAPFIMLAGGGLRTFRIFATTWDFNSAVFTVLRHILGPFTSHPAQAARVISAAILLVVAGWLWIRRAGDWEDAAMNTIGALLVLSPTVMPWYATWPLGLAVLARRPFMWIIFSGLVCLSFPMTADWKTHTGWLSLEYGALAAVMVASVVHARFGRSLPITFSMAARMRVHQ